MRKITTSIISKNRNPSVLITFKNVSEYYWTKEKIINEYNLKCHYKWCIILTGKGQRYQDLKLLVINGYVKMFKFFEDDIDLLFIFACIYGKMKVVKYFSDKIDTIKNHALYEAINHGISVKAIKYLLNRNAKSTSYWSEILREEYPINIQKRFKVIKFIFENKLFNYNPTDFLFYECYTGNLEAVKFLVEKGADINTENGSYFGHVCAQGHLEVAKFLFEKGANIHANGNFAFYRACLMNTKDEKLVKFIVELDKNYPWNFEDAIVMARDRDNFKLLNYIISLINSKST